MASHSDGLEAGFTIVELITVIIVAGILAAVALPRFVGHDAFDQRGSYDEVKAALRYAQRIAIAKRREVCVDFPPGQVVLSFNPSTVADAACSSSVNLPGHTLPYVVTIPAGITLISSANFRFNGLGQPSVAPVTVALTGRALPITVSAETGYVIN
ncbi:MAG: GspH/FimT family pseudopilin [Sterolibacterium sp.]